MTRTEAAKLFAKAIVSNTEHDRRKRYARTWGDICDHHALGDGKPLAPASGVMPKLPAIPTATPPKPPAAETATGKFKPRNQFDGPLPRAQLLPKVPAEPKLLETTTPEATALPDVPDYAKAPVIEDEPQAMAWRDAMVKTFRDGKTVARTPLSTGINVTARFKFADGTEAIWKPKRGESGGRIGIEKGTSYRREVAAALLAQAIGLGDLVPHAAFRNDKYEGVGSVARWVDRSVDAFKRSIAERFDGGEDAARAAMFDYILSNGDRNHANWKMAFDRDGSWFSDWLRKPRQLVLIDHGMTLPTKVYEADLYATPFWTHAVLNNLPMPNTKTLKARLPIAEAIMKWAGLERPAINNAMQRLEVVASGRYDKIADLPDPVDPIRNATGSLAGFLRSQRKI